MMEAGTCTNYALMRCITSRACLHMSRTKHLPHFNANANGHADQNHPTRLFLVVEEIQKDDDLHDDVDKDGLHADARHVFPVLPELNVVLECQKVKHGMQEADEDRKHQQQRIRL